eukprot:10082660-Lingulodinium_polyedra.AAC.1
MSWHTDSWPGLLALATSPTPQVQQSCVARLTKDYQAWLERSTYKKGSQFLRNATAMSPFNTVLMKEVAEALAKPMEGRTRAMVEQEVVQFA